jgi:hypothetical protein
MPRRQSVEKLLRTYLGKPAAEAMLAEIDEMVEKGAKAPAIEKMIATRLELHFKEQLVSATISAIGPTAVAKGRRIEAKVKPILNNVIVGVPRIHGVPRTHGVPKVNAGPVGTVARRTRK